MESVVAAASKTFQSKRLVYQAFDGKDEELRTWVYENVIGDPVHDALGMASMPKPATMKQAEEFVEGVSGCTLAVTICLPASSQEDEAQQSDEKASKSDDDKKVAKSKPEVIGFIGLGVPRRTAHHQGGSIALGIAAKYQGQGYGPEAINWITDWGFTHANLHRIAISAVSYNERAVALYQKLGFIVEGRERDSIRYGRERYDMINMSMLAPEWEELRKKQAV